MKKEMKAWSKLTVFAVTVLVVAYLIGLFWEAFINTPYYGYTKGFESSTSLMKIYYEKEEGEFTYRVQPPDFLRNDGYMRLRWGPEGTIIYPEDQKDKRNPPTIMLVIYPSVFKEPKYILDIRYEESWNRFGNHSSLIEFGKNDDGSYNITHKLENQEAIEIFNKNRDIVEKMLDCAEETWDFDGLDDIVYGFKVKNHMLSISVN